MDATGQTFQLTYAQLTWTGWQFVPLIFLCFFSCFPSFHSLSSTSPLFFIIVTFRRYVTLPFTASTYWGGANDGQFHLPLKLIASFLLDSTESANSGVVYFTPPVLVSQLNFETSIFCYFVNARYSFLFIFAQSRFSSCTVVLHFL